MGPTLVVRIVQGPTRQEEALEIARQIAARLVRTHSNSLPDRDLSGKTL